MSPTASVFPERLPSICSISLCNLFIQSLRLSPDLHNFPEGKLSVPSNYRLTLAFCMVIEWVIKTELVTFLTDSDALQEPQHVFVARRSCLHNPQVLEDQVTFLILADLLTTHNIFTGKIDLPVGQFSDQPS